MLRQAKRIFVGLTLLVTLTSLLNACGNGSLISENPKQTTLDTYCALTEPLIDNLVDAVIEEQTPKVLVATDEYVTTRDESCLRGS